MALRQTLMGKTGLQEGKQLWSPAPYHLKYTFLALKLHSF